MKKIFHRIWCALRGGHCFEKVSSGCRHFPGPLGRLGPWMVVRCLDCLKLEEWRDYYWRIL